MLEIGLQPAATQDLGFAARQAIGLRKFSQYLSERDKIRTGKARLHTIAIERNGAVH